MEFHIGQKRSCPPTCQSRAGRQKWWNQGLQPPEPDGPGLQQPNSVAVDWHTPVPLTEGTVLGNAPPLAPEIPEHPPGAEEEVHSLVFSYLKLSEVIMCQRFMFFSMHWSSAVLKQTKELLKKKNLQIPFIGKYLSCTCWHIKKPSLSGSLSGELWMLIALSTLSKLQRAAQTCVCTVCCRWPFSWFTVSTNCSKIFTLRKTNGEHVIHRSGLACPSCIELWTRGVV